MTGHRGVREPIILSRPVLPPLERYVAGLEAIWQSHVLSNDGPMVRALTERLAALLGGVTTTLVANGSLGLEVALAGHGLTGEVITTPFSFASSANAIVRSGLRPVFVDIEPDHFTIDPAQVEAAITPATSAILAVHVFGVPCQVAQLARIARDHRLTLVYDAAHAFGVTIDGRPIASFGDVSVFSLHATKPFHSAEGGVVVGNDAALGARFAAMINHGLGVDGVVDHPGTNAKMSELHALLGLVGLDGVAANRARANRLTQRYRRQLAGVPGVRLPLPPPAGIEVNHSYFAIRVDPAAFGCDADALVARLAAADIGARRYFHPLLSTMPAFRSDRPLPVATRIASEVVAIPIGAALTLAQIDHVAAVIAGVGRDARRAAVAGSGDRHQAQGHAR